MRIAIVTRSRRKIGGVEQYLDALMPELLDRGHEVAFWCEFDLPHDRQSIALPAGIPSWCAAELGGTTSCAKLREWKPEVVYCHGVENTSAEAEMQTIAPAIFFAHQYNGTCISGSKTWKFPVTTPCSRRFGWQCLLHYYPHRCGGLNPLTMFDQYRRQARQLDVLHKYQMVVTHSDHLRREYLQHGFATENVLKIPFPIGRGVSALREPSAGDPSKLAFLGRMDPLKGGRFLLKALPLASAALSRPLHLTLAGDGPERPALERQAAQVRLAHPDVTVEFAGWLDKVERDRLLAESDLLVVPSLWPEPFGMVGTEAGLQGTPVAAFAVGAIPEWLSDGVNGHLAPGDPPTAGGLAQAIAACIADRKTYDGLREGARRLAQRYTMPRHLDALLDILARVAKA